MFSDSENVDGTFDRNFGGIDFGGMFTICLICSMSVRTSTFAYVFCCELKNVRISTFGQILKGKLELTTCRVDFLAARLYFNREVFWPNFGGMGGWLGRTWRGGGAP